MSQQIRLRIITLVVASFLASSGIVSAQTSNATLQGSVTDSGGGVMPGVNVKLQSGSTGLQRDVITNEAGVYVFNFLPAGSYGVTAELVGFKSVKHDDITLEIGQTRELKMTLEVGGRWRISPVTDSAVTARGLRFTQRRAATGT